MYFETTVLNRLESRARYWKMPRVMQSEACAELWSEACNEQQGEPVAGPSGSRVVYIYVVVIRGEYNACHGFVRLDRVA